MDIIEKYLNTNINEVGIKKIILKYLSNKTADIIVRSNIQYSIILDKDYVNCTKCTSELYVGERGVVYNFTHIRRNWIYLHVDIIFGIKKNYIHLYKIYTYKFRSHWNVQNYKEIYKNDMRIKILFKYTEDKYKKYEKCEAKFYEFDEIYYG